MWTSKTADPLIQLFEDWKLTIERNVPNNLPY